MTHCQTCQSQLLHHLYGVLDDAETPALVAHLGDCPDCQAALDKARGQQHLLAAAAKTEFPSVRFEPVPVAAKPQAMRVASSPRRFAPRRWAIAASILVLVGGPTLWVATMWINENGPRMASSGSKEVALLETESGSLGKVNINSVGADAFPFFEDGARMKLDVSGEPIRVEAKLSVTSPYVGGFSDTSDKAAGGGGKGGGGGVLITPGGGKLSVAPTTGATKMELATPKTPVPTKDLDSARGAKGDKGGIASGLDGRLMDKDKAAVTDADKKLADALANAARLKKDSAAAKALAKKSDEPAREHKSEPGAGQLTAGSFDDSRHASSFKRFLQTLSQNSFVGGIPNQFKGRHVTITVKDSSGMPVDNARVEISSGNTSIQLLSRTDGRVIVVTPWDPLPDNAHWTVTVTPPVGEGGKAVTTECTMQMDKLDVVLPESRNMATRVLDLAMVIDCTGSMSDELEYIKSEMKWIATSIKEKYPDVKQRYALIVYRDRGDEYVTKTFQFTDSIDQLLANVKAQSANGGGDMPEAVEKAMDEAMQLQWSTGRAARVLIHVADAPPHTQDFEYSLKAVDRIRKAGIAFYPVACSGYDPPCELHMRISSLLTGGQFLFLTDDSGIGNSHAEPHIHDYHVERLAPLMLRMISSEIAGHQIDVNPQEIIRTVGNPAKTAPK